MAHSKRALDPTFGESLSKKERSAAPQLKDAALQLSEAQNDLVGEADDDLLMEAEAPTTDYSIQVHIPNFISLASLLRSVRPSVAGKDTDGEVLCVVQNDLALCAQATTGKGMFCTDTQDIAATLERRFTGLVFFVESSCKTRHSMAVFETTVRGLGPGEFRELALNSAQLLHALQVNKNAMQGEWVFTVDMLTMTISEASGTALTSEIMIEFQAKDTELVRDMFLNVLTQRQFQHCVRMNAMTCSQKLHAADDSACALALHEHWRGIRNPMHTKILTLTVDCGCKMLDMFIKENEPSGPNLDLRQTMLKAPKAAKKETPTPAAEEVLQEESEEELRQLLAATTPKATGPKAAGAVQQQRITAKQVSVWKTHYAVALDQKRVKDGAPLLLSGSGPSAEYYQLVDAFQFSSKNMVAVFKEQVNELSDGIALLFGGPHPVISLVMPMRSSIFVMHIFGTRREESD